jgi:hypothetical protein
MFQSFLWIILGLVQNLGETEVSWHALRIEFQTVLEVFLSLGILAQVGELSCQVDSRSKMLRVKSEALLKLLDSIFVHLLLFVLNTKVKVSTQVWSGYFDRCLEAKNGFIDLV